MARRPEPDIERVREALREREEREQEDREREEAEREDQEDAERRED